MLKVVVVVLLVLKLVTKVELVDQLVVVFLLVLKLVVHVVIVA